MDDRLTLDEVVELIASRDRRDGEGHRDAKNRTSKRIGYAVTTGKLHQAEDGSFTRADVIVWVSRNWPGMFDDFPVIGRLSATLPKMTCNSFGSGPMPETIEECHAQLKAAQQRVAALEKEVADLKPDAEKYRANCKTNKANARKKRGY